MWTCQLCVGLNASKKPGTDEKSNGKSTHPPPKEKKNKKLFWTSTHKPVGQITVQTTGPGRHMAEHGTCALDQGQAGGAREGTRTGPSPSSSSNSFLSSMCTCMNINARLVIRRAIYTIDPCNLKDACDPGMDRMGRTSTGVICMDWADLAQFFMQIKFDQQPRMIWNSIAN